MKLAGKNMIFQNKAAELWAAFFIPQICLFLI